MTRVWVTTQQEFKPNEQGGTENLTIDPPNTGDEAMDQAITWRLVTAVLVRGGVILFWEGDVRD